MLNKNLLYIKLRKCYFMLTAAYSEDPVNTNSAPSTKPGFQLCLKSQTLRHKLMAFLVVSAKFVATELTRYEKIKTKIFIEN